MSNTPVELEVINTWTYNAFPHFSRPAIVGYFSIDGARKFSPDLSQLKYFKSQTTGRNVNLNLNLGFQSVQRKPPSADEERLDHLLQWILLNVNKIRAPTNSDQWFGFLEHYIRGLLAKDYAVLMIVRWLSPDFVCFRGLLTRLWCTPFETKEGWIICACKYRGTIYLCMFDTMKQKEEKRKMTQTQLRFMSWGFKFEQYMLADSPDKLPNVRIPVNEAEEFCCLFRSRLGNNSLLFGAEMDGVDSKVELQDPIDWRRQKLVEFKTSRIIETDRQMANFTRFKLIKWWCQSFLVGIENILCGFRDDSGFVCELRNYRVKDIPKLGKEAWNAATCMHFGNDFLEFVKSVVRKDYDQSVYKFERIPGGNVRFEELPSDSEYSFLPRWFTDKCEPYPLK